MGALLSDPEQAERFTRSVVDDLVRNDAGDLDRGFRGGRPLAHLGLKLREAHGLVVARVDPSLAPTALFLRALAAAVGAFGRARGYRVDDLAEAAAAAVGPAPGAPLEGAQRLSFERDAPRRIELAPPPRALDATTKLATVLGAGGCQAGYAAVLFGSILFWVFSARSEAATALELRGELRTTTAIVRKLEATSSSENKVKIWEVEYDYAVDGRKLHGSSYARGRPALGIGAEVPLEYAPARPDRARIVGLRGRPFGALVAILALFPLIGPLAFASGVVSGLRALRLLSRGKLAMARLVKKESRLGSKTKQPVAHDLTFEFVEGGETFRTAPMKRRAVVSLTVTEAGPVLDEPLEGLLFDPADPGGPVAMIDALPSGAKVVDGRIANTLGLTGLFAALALVDLVAMGWFALDLLGAI